jgi:hypothetical protein
MSSTFEWKDMVGAFPWPLTSKFFGPPFGHTSRFFFAWSETQTGPELVLPEESGFDDCEGEEDDEDDDGVVGKSSFADESAARETRAPPATSAMMTSENDRTRFILTSRTST